MKFVFILGLCVLVACQPKKEKTIVDTWAGNEAMGNAEGIGAKASFSNPSGIDVDSLGNVYVADANNNLIKKIDTHGNTTIFAGSGDVGQHDGAGKEASFYYPTAVAVHSKNIFVADTYNNSIRKIDEDGRVTTVPLPADIRLDHPKGIAVDKSGVLFVSDFTDRIFKITADGKAIVFAGAGKRGSKNGPLLEAEFYVPTALAFDASGNLFVCDSYNNRIRRVGVNGIVTTVAGGKKGFADGALDYALFNHPNGIAVSRSGDVYVADTGNNRIRKISNGKVTTFAGSGTRGASNGDALMASFWAPTGIAITSRNTLYVSDFQNNMVRIISQQ